MAVQITRRDVGSVTVLELKERWTPSFGQVFVTAKVGSGS